MAEVYDRWYRRDPATGQKIHSADYGCKSRWQVRWRDDTRNQKKQNFVKRAQADVRRAEIEDTLNKGTYVDPIAGKRKLRDYVREWLATLTTDPATRIATVRRVKLHILPTLGDMELRAIRPSTVQAWLRGLSDELAATYVRVLYAHFTAIMSAAVDDGLIPRSPCAAKSVKPPAPERRRIIPWTAERVATVTAELPERYRVVAVLASGLGLRIGECLGVGVDDVDFLHRVVHVRRQVKKVGTLWVFAPPKGGKERDVPLPEQVALRLDR